MKGLALVVALSRGEELRRELRDRGLLRSDLQVVREPDALVLPIRSAPEPPIRDVRIEEREFPPASVRRPRSYRELVELPAELRPQLPRAFDVIGEVVLIRIPPELESEAPRIGAALQQFVPSARRVGWDRGVHGEERRRTIVSLAGHGPWRTRYRENGLELVVDPEIAYFSPRLAGEHARVAAEVRTGESVLDLCCGVGPFALTIARDARARSVTAVDVNPDAIELLRENARRLGLSKRIRSLVGPIETFLRTAEPADRVIFNLPHDGIKYLPSVSASVAPGGRLHYYELTPRASVPMRAKQLVDMLPGPTRWRTHGCLSLHPYSPQSDLVSFTFARE